MKNHYFLLNLHETLWEWLAHGIVTLAKFDKDQAKIKYFLLTVCFEACAVFFGSVSMRTFNYYESLQLLWEPSVTIWTFSYYENLQLLWKPSVTIWTFSYYENLQLLWKPSVTIWTFSYYENLQLLWKPSVLQLL